MTLLEALGYRSQCLIHDKMLKPCPVGPTDRADECLVNERGLHLLSHSRWDIRGKPSLTGLGYYFNGNCYRNDVCPAWAKNGCIQIRMICDECRRVPIIKSRGLGFTSLQDLRTVQYFYQFALKAKLLSDDIKEEIVSNYTCELSFEKVKYIQDDKFYHVDSDLTNNETFIKMGTNKGATRLGDLLDTYLDLTVPKLDMKRIETIEQLVDKVKLYNLFS